MSSSNGTSPSSNGTGRAGGFTQYPNWLLDLCNTSPELILTDVRIIGEIVRHTYGWHRESWKCSYREMSELINTDERHVRRSCKKLKNMGIITSIAEPGRTSEWVIADSDSCGNPEVTSAEEHVQEPEYTLVYSEDELFDLAVQEYDKALDEWAVNGDKSIPPPEFEDYHDMVLSEHDSELCRPSQGSRGGRVDKRGGVQTPGTQGPQTPGRASIKERINKRTSLTSVEPSGSPSLKDVPAAGAGKPLNNNSNGHTTHSQNTKHKPSSQNNAHDALTTCVMECSDVGPDDLGWCRAISKKIRRYCADVLLIPITSQNVQFLCDGLYDAYGRYGSRRLYSDRSVWPSHLFDEGLLGHIFREQLRSHTEHPDCVLCLEDLVHHGQYCEQHS